jgi:phage anti-repressor protein
MKKKPEKQHIKNNLFISIDGRMMVKSFEFYQLSGLHRPNYTRWVTETVLGVGAINQDYIPAPVVQTKDKKRIRVRYYFDIDFAIGLCLLVRRDLSLDLRNFLIISKTRYIPESHIV